MQARDDYVMVPEREINPDTGESYSPVMVGFALQAKLDGKATKVAGHEVYKDVEFVQILIPGDKLTKFEQPATELHRKRFPNAYAAFQRRGLKGVQGLPLEQWPGIARSMILTLRSANVETVEMLAELSDQHIDKLGYGFRELRTKAKTFLASAKDSAVAQQLADEKEALEKRLAAMQAQLDAVLASGPAKAQPKPVKEQIAPDVRHDVVAAARRPRARPAA